MDNYDVKVTWEHMAFVRVQADSKEDAIQKAMEQSPDLVDYWDSHDEKGGVLNGSYVEGSWKAGDEVICKGQDNSTSDYSSIFEAKWAVLK